MAGIYIHIPFCSQKCNYCDFYSIVPLIRKEEFLKSLILEIKNRRNYLGTEPIETLYFGGGTPSLLSIQELSSITRELGNSFSLASNIEFTLEANPEDLTDEYLKEIQRIGVNRLSIGVQSFHDSDLRFLKRSHDSQKAYQAVERAYKLGVENISIDLIYGLPNLTMSSWLENLRKAFSLPIIHLSSYHLTYEKNTLLYKRLKQGRVQPIHENTSVDQFKLLLDFTEKNNMPFYEISNFASENHYSKHNLSYWQQKNYLGLGPSAHSFNGQSRDWNVSSIQKYIEGFRLGRRDYEQEILTKTDLNNEYLMTKLRTKWGINLSEYTKTFGEVQFELLMKNSNPYLGKEVLVSNNQMTLSTRGLIISDAILEKLFII